jgi:single-strand DNA-binding protein
MNDTLVTVVGNVATEPEASITATGVPTARFRLATTSRRWDAERGGWTDGSTSFYTVRSWRNLAGNVKESVTLGEPLVVQGRLRIREEEKDGRRYLTAEIDAVALGHDLTRGLSRFTRGSSASLAPRADRTAPTERADPSTDPFAPAPPPPVAVS